jgi:hypothetical protein
MLSSFKHIEYMHILHNQIFWPDPRTIKEVPGRNDLSKYVFPMIRRRILCLRCGGPAGRLDGFIHSDCISLLDTTHLLHTLSRVPCPAHILTCPSALKYSLHLGRLHWNVNSVGIW